MKGIYFYIFFSIVLMACQTGSRKTEAQQMEGKKWDAVMAKHDIIMPMMSTTHTLRKKLKSYSKNNNTDPSEVQRLINNLERADEDMMDWMHGYKKLGALQKDMNHEQIMQYLAKEDEKINQLKKLFDSSIEEGEGFLDMKKQIK